ncbi:34-kDa subunit of RNA polymerase III (C) [Verticillium nonalfalfae]|uniref:DNA-directed RNA polymerase III subunit RPC6 n=1 Tax=Verticillium nonalfalfae TaxID=1051616 RepID=A0A3M9YKC2_9PEZI|nr:34-kDa subunit of RNA polymerase III (C) [Verticillium nonalfalfae]RNJ60008.1 34-kDa subunit of RNA polymerase III (C) [Verticillium nonalfalfae]
MAPEATTPSTATPASSATDPTKLEVIKQAIYEACQNNGGEDQLYTQDDLLELDVIPNRDASLLLKALQSLSNEKLLNAVATQSGLAWRWRPKAEAAKYKLCTTDEQRMVYGMIDDAGGDGIWSKTIINRLSMNDTVMKAAIKQLHIKGLIVPFKNVEHPNKKMYIKASMQPSERATGGPWFTDQTLDEAFIEELQRVIYDYIKRQSSYFHKGGEARAAVPKKGIVKGGPPAGGRKRGAEQISDDANGGEAHAVGATQVDKTTYLPLPAGYKEYPTVRDIARFISQAGITTETTLGVDDIQKLVDVLVFDGLVEAIRVGGKHGLRVRRAAKQSLGNWAGQGADESGIERGAPEPYANGYTEAPCGRCPVFDLCEEGGPVSASNCVYYQRWLGLE